MNYYQILGLSENADKSEIKKRYRALSLQHHPDRNNGNDSHFKKINEAYQTLNDPVKKANYDFRRKYQHKTNQASQQNYYSQKTQNKKPTQNPQKNRFQKQRAFYAKQVQKSRIKEDKRFIRQLIISVGILFILIIGNVSYNAIQENKKHKKIAAKNKMIQNTIKNTRSLMNNEDYELALKKLADIYKIHKYDRYLDIESKAILKQLIQQAHFYFEQNSYEQALKIYEALDHYTPLESKYIYEMAHCYRFTKKSQQAIDKLLFLIKNDYAAYRYFYEIASIYDQDLEQHGEAIHYYEKACNIITHNYQVIYGKAYIITLDPKKLPKEHFAVFYDKAMNYYNLEDYEKALGSLKWANNLQRKNDVSLYYQGVCLYKLNKIQEACDCWDKAYSFNYKPQIKNKISELCE